MAREGGVTALDIAKRKKNTAIINLLTKEQCINSNCKIHEIESTIDFDKIRRGFKKFSLKYHPDKGGNDSKFQEGNNAYHDLEEILGPKI